ncbi:MAG: 3-isopropylmalate dehydratase large subunit [Rhodospirillaceae bacterium]|jgi:3-isopropylmalate/(R)-2-methylmalate dehydratase large subunit|nr:3-isopropylmalate dehydratase large subunit [Rhodospirillaceae bacterium]MBT5456952.1 3-isopropylmalate dehydratase large subunit [Rhodospirillaceae bacterium]
MSKTLFEKIWDRHVVTDLGDGFALVFVDRHMIPEVAAAQVHKLKDQNLALKYPQLTFGVSDHTVPAMWAALENPEDRQNDYTKKMKAGAAAFGFHHFDVDTPDQGISHIVAAEQGLALPGTTLACVDSHVCTVGALGGISWAFGASEVFHVLATQTSILRKPPTMRINMDGTPAGTVTPKDIALYLVGQIGAAGALGRAVEFAGPVVRAMPMEGRFTLCNMAVEMGAAFATIQPDDITFDYLKGRRYAPAGAAWDSAMAQWRLLKSDDDARFDHEASIDFTQVAPQVSWGISPQDVISVDGIVPDPAAEPDSQKRHAMEAGLDHTGLTPGVPIEGTEIDWVFIGSCTNNRISDLRAAAKIIEGHAVADNVTAWVVPGSLRIRAQAEEEGLDRIFSESGFNWGWPGCSMCGGQGNGFTERLKPGIRAVSTINRNLPGRQGPGSITHLVSPPMAAAAAITGRITDVRKLEG